MERIYIHPPFVEESFRSPMTSWFKREGQCSIQDTPEGGASCMIWQSKPVLESGDDHKKFQRKLGAKNGVMLARALGLAYNTEHPVTKVRHGEENFVFRATSIVDWQRRQGTRELGN